MSKPSVGVTRATVLWGAARPYVGVSVLVGSMLSVAMAVANWQRLGWPGALEMAVVMFWVSFLFNAVLMVPVLVCWAILAALRPAVFGGRWTTYCLTALLALNIVWVLWNRLAMVHQWASVRPFITVAGLVQSLVLFVMLVLLVAVPFLRLRGWRGAAWVASGAVVLAVAVVLVWNGWAERRERRYPVDRIARAAGVSRAEVPADDAAGGAASEVVVLGLDGLSWDVMVPMMEVGSLPTLSALIRRGAFGYLDNADDSLSPIVWTTIFTGRTPANHGIEGYLELDLPVSGRSALDLLLVRPTIDSVYGLPHLLKRLPSAGLWHFSHVGSNDRTAPTLWEIASLFGRTVVVVDPLVNLPVRPVNGAAIDFRRTRDPSIATSYPTDLRQRWNLEPIPLATGGTDASYDRLVERVLAGVDITFELAEDYDPDLLVYYTNLLDTVAHMNWDFYARDRVFIADLPVDLTDAEWENLVRSNLDDRLFRAYVQTDAIVGRFLETFPGATLVIVSDHGWTFSGYEHFGSPDGVIIVSGPCVRNGVGLSGTSILDVAPTVLAALGIPLSRELEGSPIVEIVLERNGSTFVERYPAPPGDDGAEVQLSDEELERLRALGYLE